MYIKLLGENENGFPEGCTVGKVYEIVGNNGYDIPYFIDDVGDKDFAFDYLDSCCIGKWKVVDKEGNVL